MDPFLAIWIDQAMPSHTQPQHATGTSVQRCTGSFSSSLFRIQAHLKCSDMKTLQFTSWLTRQLSFTYLRHRSSWSGTRSHLIETQQSMIGTDMAFHNKIKYKPEEMVRFAPTALLICIRSIRDWIFCLKVFKVDKLLSFLGNRIMSSQLWKMLVRLCIFHGGLWGFFERLFAWLGFGGDISGFVLVIRRLLPSSSKYSCIRSLIVTVYQPSYYMQLASTSCLLFLITSCKVTLCPAITHPPANALLWIIIPNNVIKKGWY